MNDEPERRIFSDLAAEIHRQEQARKSLERSERIMRRLAIAAMLVLGLCWMAFLVITRSARVWPKQ